MDDRILLFYDLGDAKEGAATTMTLKARNNSIMIGAIVTYALMFAPWMYIEDIRLRVLNSAIWTIAYYGFVCYHIRQVAKEPSKKT